MRREIHCRFSYADTIDIGQLAMLALTNKLSFVDE